ncbi:hypothetical protein ACXITP_00845 [Actinotignum sanguinis]|uniref:Uncharacterized protein n=1 Tax=Schaalia turicensis TaxID=131111 RepID=A0ABZ0RB34_9ACTO|nr:hypothetical protein [Actinotignum sanguinis]WPJ88645.1 hypothetical protein R0V15_07180 [Schaalia turicensis]MDK8513199.1 hypothetical protein [Actinotignum sanguinis]MDK8519845.1 hypothetical protein [Actinotignum sanguinis]MDK8749455.1 hypothetical protein [Actinotignum sanguinis]MDY5137179.1 hypothetical protein [Actinotignum sanguinis]
MMRRDTNPALRPRWFLRALIIGMSTVALLGSCTVSAPALAREYEDNEERVYTAHTDGGGVTVEGQARYTRRLPAGAAGALSGSDAATGSDGGDSGYSGGGPEDSMTTTATGSGTDPATGAYGLPWSRGALVAAVRDTSLPGHVRGAAGILSWILGHGTPPASSQAAVLPSAAQLETIIHTESIRIAAANAAAWMEPARGWVAINYPVHLHYSAPAQRHTVTLLGAEVVIDLVPVRVSWEVPGATSVTTGKAGNTTPSGSLPGHSAQPIPARQPYTEVIYHRANEEVKATLIVEWEVRYTVAGQSRTVPQLLTTRSETAPVITRELEAHLIG